MAHLAYQLEWIWGSTKQISVSVISKKDELYGEALPLYVAAQL